MCVMFLTGVIRFIVTVVSLNYQYIADPINVQHRIDLVLNI